ncbi:unnamed protein product [Penicillium salamii]|uniref:Uncharacterized protein n=1 Tax=Penicillium salamii TaxID=1612424 RepID=A0A9W4I4C1_9EURO|nr:unnamed protein product [Penicillium salamii]CAG8156649.1 unnamed protein product [Penicillium salamii]CAG8236298.1 unnamed protein product [Penicillium salamii]CAG8259536.1 unnamed protein product [Penicillium salamii]CAG8380811.1 unnamed protein product [Penicillium salamii]
MVAPEVDSFDVQGPEDKHRCLVHPPLWGSVFGDEKHLEDIQPDIYRASEVILEVPWACSVDIWNVGCIDPEFQTYRSRAHLAEMIRLLGPPPPGLLARGNPTQKLFTEEGRPIAVLIFKAGPSFQHVSNFLGNFCAGIPVQEHTPLGRKGNTLQGREKEKFLCLVRKIYSGSWRNEALLTNLKRMSGCEQNYLNSLEGHVFPSCHCSSR